MTDYIPREAVLNIVQMATGLALYDDDMNIIPNMGHPVIAELMRIPAADVVEPECYDARPCFSKVRGRCKILKDTYPDADSPFCKRNINDKLRKEKHTQEL